MDGQVFFLIATRDREADAISCSLCECDERKIMLAGMNREANVQLANFSKVWTLKISREQCRLMRFNEKDDDR